MTKLFLRSFFTFPPTVLRNPLFIYIIQGIGICPSYKLNYSILFFMNKAELSAVVHEHLGRTKVEAEQVVSLIFDTIVKEVSSGQEVTVAGFGSFTKRPRAARQGRNPKTGEVLRIPASHTVKFKVAKAFKDTVAG